jgi:hypothetical protein
LGLGRAG